MTTRYAWQLQPGDTIPAGHGHEELTVAENMASAAHCKQGTLVTTAVQVTPRRTLSHGFGYMPDTLTADL
jgi:BarA-like signal transduction histidine kinase